MVFPGLFELIFQLASLNEVGQYQRQAQYYLERLIHWLWRSLKADTRPYKRHTINKATILKTYYQPDYCIVVID